MTFIHLEKACIGHTGHTNQSKFRRLICRNLISKIDTDFPSLWPVSLHINSIFWSGWSDPILSQFDWWTCIKKRHCTSGVISVFERGVAKMFDRIIIKLKKKQFTNNYITLHFNCFYISMQIFLLYNCILFNWYYRL